MRNYILLMLAVFLLAGCQSDATKEDAAGATTTTTDAVETGKLAADGKGQATAFTAGEEPYRKDAINDATSPLSQQVIYFDFNASTIKEEYRDLITWHGRYLASNADMKLRLEGHTDERGSREYNVALADSRAQAVSRMLMFQGAAKKQIEVISYGEEKPVALEHNEEAWSKNRRVQLVYEAI
ncbi:MAG: peptidoglycan-associated lipoprotein Pal [Gammaproteobacteria bacterium]|nr:peptidoglycan-associated lipoprotein Pal [Gammaproteobacteria bacterium]